MTRADDGDLIQDGTASMDGLDDGEDRTPVDGPDSTGEVVEGVVLDHPGSLGNGGDVAATSGRGGPPLPALPARPVVPAWLATRANRRAAIAWGARYAALAAGFHVIRVPVYWARLAGRSPAGIWRAARVVGRWVFDADSAAIRRGMSAQAASTDVGGADAAAYTRLVEQRRRTVRVRTILASLVLAVLVAAGWTAAVVLPGWQSTLLAAALLAVLGGAGRRPDGKAIVHRHTDTSDAPRLTSELILTALGAIGLSGLNKGLRPGADGIRFPSPIARDGAGWRADIDLPPGVPAGEVIDRRAKLAAGLRRPLSSVWPEGDSDIHEGRLVLWVADKPMSKAKPVTWPLAAKGSVDLFEPFPLGVDPRGRPVTVTLMFASMVIGAMPRAGKTFTGRVIMLAAALDVRAELYVFDLKGGSDWLPLAPVCHAFRVGDEPEDIAYVLSALRELHQDMRRRYQTLRKLPRDVCPEGKITPALASRKGLRLHPVVAFVDECQIAYEHPQHGAEIADLVTDLTKRGPAAGITMISATQRPDKDSLPTGIRSNAVLRLCLRVQGQVENDMVLGTSAYRAGHRATMFARSENGVGYLAGEGDDPVIVRAAYLDATNAEKIVARARAARAAAGRLTGYAANEDPAPDTSTASVLDHLATVWPAGEDRAWCETLATRLADTYPGVYEGWTGENVTHAVKPHGLSVRQVKLRGVNRRGLARDDLTAALTDRDNPGTLDHPAREEHQRDSPAVEPGW
ncbi:MAG: FtsK/SpoIIIE domain-containing protein [Dermatophilaceae bacterium]